MANKPSTIGVNDHCSCGIRQEGACLDRFTAPPRTVGGGWVQEVCLVRVCLEAG